MLNRQILIIVTALTALFAAGAHAADNTPDYDAIAAKAARFFSHEEWSSASAMYTLMIDERPAVPSVYGSAMVAAGMRQAADEQLELLNKALQAHVPIDSLVLATRNAAFESGHAQLFEEFLITVKEGEPWLKRTIDAYLLDYYVFRDDGPGIVRLSREMLAGLPDNEGFTYKLARGQLLTGDIAGAMESYRDIVERNPKAYDALLYLGNYYAQKSGESTDDALSADYAAKARTYLDRANAIRPTPYVSRLLRRLSPD